MGLNFRSFKFIIFKKKKLGPDFSFGFKGNDFVTNYP